MRDFGLMFAFLLLLSPACVMAQEPDGARGVELTRKNRVVVHSPHFDTPLPRWTGLSCPGGPLHLYGFEGSHPDSASSFSIRTFLYNPTLTREYVVITDGSRPTALKPVDAMFHLISRIEESGEKELPMKAPWLASADETGLAVLSVPPGEYRIRFYMLGIGEAEGIIRVRGVEGDSIHAYLIPGAICNQ